MLAWLKQHRRRIATLIALVAIGVVGGQLVGAWPRNVELDFDLGPDHASLSEVRIAYVIEGEEVKGARFQAPLEQHLHHQVELVPGRYEIEAYLQGSRGLRLIHRALDVPAQGVVRVDLFDAAVARRL